MFPRFDLMNVQHRGVRWLLIKDVLRCSTGKNFILDNHKEETKNNERSIRIYEWTLTNRLDEKQLAFFEKVISSLLYIIWTVIMKQLKIQGMISNNHPLSRGFFQRIILETKHSSLKLYHISEFLRRLWVWMKMREYR